MHHVSNFSTNLDLTPRDSSLVYGHSERGLPAVEVHRYSKSSNLTLNLLIGMHGVMHCCGGNDLAMFSDYYGIEYIFTPTYSKHPVERAFSKINSVISRPEFLDIVHDNLDNAIYYAVGFITSADCVGYYRLAGYMNLIWTSVVFILQRKCLHFCAVQCECSITYHT